jgi:hypoxanthine phosphoribosyltransferase
MPIIFPYQLIRQDKPKTADQIHDRQKEIDAILGLGRGS